MNHYYYIETKEFRTKEQLYAAIRRVCPGARWNSGQELETCFETYFDNYPYFVIRYNNPRGSKKKEYCVLASNESYSDRNHIKIPARVAKLDII